MAKGNPFLGDARGSVGDVTLYVKNGQQVTRVRRRSVRNPSSDGQLIQRAILATIGKAYQAGAAIFNHSFEGVETGAKSQARFQKENLRIVRQLIVGDLDEQHGDGSSLAAVVSRGAVWPVANPYRISTGSLIQDFITVEPNSENLLVDFKFPEPLENETLAQYCTRCRLIDDDIFTICTFAIVDSAYDSEDQLRYRKSYKTVFSFLRLRVKTSAISSSSLVRSVEVSDLFEIDGPNGDTIGGDGVATVFNMSYLAPGVYTGSLGVIRSRENSGQRSNCDMVCPDSIEWGIIAKYLHDEWDPNALQAGESSLILEGGGFQ